LETMFSVRSLQSIYKEEFKWKDLAEFREASLPGHELGSRDIQLRESPEVTVGRIIEKMAKNEFGCGKEASCMSCSYSETVVNPLLGNDKYKV
jgi:hypothetical protein